MLKNLVMILLGCLAIYYAVHYLRGDSDAIAPSNHVQTVEPAQAEPTVLNGHVQTINKAKNVENHLKSAFKQRDAAMDAQSQ